jgi:hypothetical protein
VSGQAAPVILFGAFDRHNFGDLLFPHIVAKLLEGAPLVPAGLAERDLREQGGHRVAALSQAAVEAGELRTHLIHVGGELLTCDAWQAAVMLLAPDDVRPVIAAYDGDPAARTEWARRYLGIERDAPYLAPKNRLRRPGALIYNAMGGVDLARRDAPFRAEVLKRLGEADYLGVRDGVTQETLVREGMPARLLPDCVSLLAELFGERIARCGLEGEVARVRAAFPQGYLAIQFSADFGDDATLETIATQLDEISQEAGLGLVFFRAGAAPWHDDAACFRRAAGRLKRVAFLVFESLNIWEICALIAASRGYCGSSLHGRIVAMAFDLPRVNLLHPAQHGRLTKQEAYAATWDGGEMPGAVAPEQLAQGLCRALQVSPAAMAAVSERSRTACRQGYEAWRALLA